MFFVKFFIFCYIFFILIVVLFKIAKLDANKFTKRCIRLQQFSIKPYTKLQKIIAKTAEKAFLKLTDSMRASSIRDKDRALQLESDPRRVQRQQREVLRIQTHQPMDTCNLNLDVLPLLFKYLLIFTGLLFIYCNSGVVFVSSYIAYNFFFLSIIYAMLHLIVTRLVLRHSRFWWWRPWPLVLHRYVKGFRPKNYQKTLYILLLPIPFYLYVIPFILYFLSLRLKQHFLFFMYEETWGFIIFSYFVEYSKFVLFRYYKIKKKVKRHLRKLRKPLRTVWRFVRLWRNKPKKKFKK